MHTSPPCQICNSGHLTLRKTFRLSGPAVVIGYIFLIPSILGMLLGTLFLVGSCGAAAKAPANSESDLQEIREKMEQAGLPEAMITKVLDGEFVGESERAGLSDDQRKALLQGSGEILGPKIAKGAGVFVAGGVSIFIIFVSFAGGLVGWLLTMKKRVLKCGNCGATVSAS